MSAAVGGAGTSAGAAGTGSDSPMEDRTLRGARRGSMSLTALTKATAKFHESAKRARNAVEQRKRAEFALIASTAEKWQWIVDDKEGYMPAKILKENPDGSMEVEYGIGRSVKVVKKAEIGPQIISLSEIKNHVDDMVRMGDVNEATILHNLRMRFAEDLIYTNIGTILVSINPFNNSPQFAASLYNTERIYEHLNLPPGEIASPHVFQIAAAAFHGMRGERKNQAVIISGESGAGKTEATKKCLQFFAEAAGSAHAGMQDRLLSANPILEAFGNAKTVRNNNSSRFGKWMEVHFNGRGQICGCRIINYLLEKSRVVFQAQQERNYHIFYMLPVALTGELRERLALSGPEHYSYTNRSGCITVDGIHDAQEFGDLLAAFDSVDFKKPEIEMLFEIVGGLLHLSNVTFVASDGGTNKDKCEMDTKPTTRAELVHAARLLGCEPDLLKKCLEQKLRRTTTEIVWSPLTPEGATDARNSMAKAIYGRMFDWLVHRVNASMVGQLATSSNTIGVLDIFGFEIFENNSFEQLCINYCNEKLQQHFNYHVFKAEERCYKAEEIDYAEVRFIDNQDVLDLIEDKTSKALGLMPRLDDTSRAPGGSDTVFVTKITSDHTSNPRFRAKPKQVVRTIDGTPVASEYLFGVNHYAGPVVYNATSFLEKNKDELLLNIKEILAASTNAFIKELFSDAAAPAAGAAASAGGGAVTGGAKDKKSQSSQFRDQLAELMETLNATEPHYIRCVKPNSVKKAGIFEAPICLQQLRYAGVFEAVKIRQQGFPFRWTHETFYKRYRCCSESPAFRDLIPKTGIDWKAGCNALAADISGWVGKAQGSGAGPSLYESIKFGKTMVLYRADQHRTLEMIRDYRRESAASTVQRVFRGHRARKHYRVLRESLKRVRAAIKARDLTLVTAAFTEAKALGIPPTLHEMMSISALHARLVAERDCRLTLTGLLAFDPVDKYAEYEAALKEAERLALEREELTVSVQAKFNTVKDRIETKANLLKGIDLGDRPLIVASLKRAEELRAEWGEIVPAETVARAQEVLQIIAREEVMLVELRKTISLGSVRGSVGAIDVTGVDVAALDHSIAEALSGRVRISTQVGKNLIFTAQKVRDMRTAFKAGEWAAIEAAVAAALELKAASNLAVEAEPEVALGAAEVADRRIVRAITAALATGAARGRVGELAMATADVAGLHAALNDATSQAAAVGSLSSTGTHLLACARQLLKLRQAIVASDWAAIRRCVQECTDLRMPDSTAAEVHAAKDEVENHSMINELTNALERGHASGTVAKLDVSTIDVTLLTDRIGHAEAVGPKTLKAQQLLKLAKIIRKARLALQSADYASLPELARQAATVPSDLIPQIVHDELLVAQFEGENVVIVRTLKEAISTGGPRGLIGALPHASVNTSVLSAALKKASSLKCRSDESLWLYDVAEALLDMRTCFREKRWEGLQEVVLAVKSNDKRRPTKTVALVDAAPVLKAPAGAHSHAAPASMALPHAVGSRPGTRMSMMPGADVLSSGIGHRSRAPSFEGRDALARAAGAASAAAAAVSSASSPAPVDPSAVSDEFSLPSPLMEELRLVQDELDNYNLITEMGAAVKTGAATGPLGELDASTAQLADLELALKRHDRPTAAKTPQAASLLYTGRALRDVRTALRSGDWAAVESQLNMVAVKNARVVRAAAASNPGSAELAAAAMATAIPTSSLGRIDVPPSAEDPGVLETASYTLSEAGIAEIGRLEAEVEYRRVMARMAAALESHGPTVGVAGLDMTPVSVADLARAIDASRALNARTERSRHLTTLCRLMWQMRTAALEDDWPSVESLLAASGDVIGKTSPLPAGCEAPPQLLAELELYRLEANNRRIVTATAAAMGEGGASGEIGRLDIASIDVRKLEDAIRLALHLGAETQEAKCLVATALHLRSMRLALMGGQWDRLGELLDYLHTAVDKARPFAMSAAYAATRHPASGCTPASKFAAQVYSNSKAGVGVMGSWPAAVDPSTGFDVAIHGVCGLIAAEVDTLQLELNNRNIVVQLTAAIARGAASGTTGHLDLSTVETGQLEWAIDFAQRIGCTTDDAKQMLATAQIAKKIRLALMAGDWNRLESALAEAQGKVLADIGEKEIHAAQDELNNRAVLSELAAALARGRPQGRTGRLYIGSIDVKPLNEAIALATKLVPKTVEARQMLFTAKVVARLRLCLLNEDLAEASMTLEAVRGKMLASVSMPEVRLVQDEVDNWAVVSDLTAAITTGCVTGAPGALYTGALDASGLEKAIDKAEELGTKTAEATSLLQAAKLLYRLRSALAADRWGEDDPAGVEAVLREAAEAPALSELAKTEIALVQAESENRRMVTSMAAALASGPARGPIGELDLSGVETAALDAAIADASELGPKTEEAEKLLQASKLIRRLRSVQLAGNWQWVGSVLLEARGVKHIFPPACLKELQLAQDELDNRAIIAQMTAALRAGCISGAVGHTDPATIDVEGVDEALAYARTLGVKSSEASNLVATAQLIRRLRVAFKDGDMGAAGEVLEATKGKTLAPVSADEVQLAKLNVDNWTVITELTAATATGAAVGILGDPDIKAVRVDALDVALAQATQLGCHTPEARKALVTALIIRRVRAALISSDFVFLEQVVAEADREADSLSPVAKAEVQAARDLLAYRDAMSAASKAIEAQDEAQLADALARAARLNLAEHPKAHVRETVEAATLALGRIQRCKAALASGIKSLEASTLIDALAMAASIGYANPLVDEAKRVLSTVQQLTDRAMAALRAMDAVEMQAVVRDCEAIAFNVPVLGDIRRALALPRSEFLRRELAAILALAASPTAPLATHQPLAEGARAPTTIERRVVECTLQLKDMFFADQPDADEAALLDGTSTVSAASSSPALAAARAERNTQANVRGTAMRAATQPHLGGYAWALAGPSPSFGSAASASAGGASTPFRPGGVALPGAPGMIGGVVPPPHSKLRRQFELSKIPKLKPAHMFSRKFGVSESADSTLLRWQHEPIHTSLTLLQDANTRRLAVKAFRDILAFMGDRPLSRPLDLAAELLELAVATPELRDEVYVQLCKQLTGNPSVASLERGWVLLHACLATFPPSEDLENHLELFLRERAAVPTVWALHLTLYRGGPGIAGAPTTSEIQVALERAQAPVLPALTFDTVTDEATSAAIYAASPARAETDATAPLAASMRSVPPMGSLGSPLAASIGSPAAGAASLAPKPSAAAVAAAVSAAAAHPVSLDALLAGGAQDLDIDRRLATIASTLAAHNV